MSPGITGTFFHRMYSLIKRMESEGIYIDPKDLFYELQNWDSKARNRKKEIAQKIAHMEEEKIQ